MSAARKGAPGRNAAAKRSVAKRPVAKRPAATRPATKSAAKRPATKQGAARKGAAKKPVRGGLRVWGEGHPAAQLTERRVIRYRELVRSGKATVGELAAREGCSHGRISMAVRGATWQHLNAVAPPVVSTRGR